MTLLIEALSGVTDTFLIYLFMSGFHSSYRNTKYKGHLYLILGIFITILSCIPMTGILRLLLSWCLISLSTYAIFESTVRKNAVVGNRFSHAQRAGRCHLRVPVLSLGYLAHSCP